MKKKEKKILITLTVTCVVLVCIALGSCIWYVNKVENSKFVPPPFDATAVAQDAPKVDGWQEIKHSEYVFGICTTVDTASGEECNVWLYNDAENENVWLKLRIKDEKGEILGETGLAKPGECIQKVTLEREITKGEKITYYVMGYDHKYRSLTPFPFEPKNS